MASISVDIDLGDLDDEDLIDEIKKRGLFPDVHGRDAEYLKECIQKQDWDGCKIYFQRIFPDL